MNDATYYPVDPATYPAGSWWPAPVADDAEPVYHFVRGGHPVGVCGGAVVTLGGEASYRLDLPKNWLCVECRALVSDVMPGCDIAEPVERVGT